MEFFGGRERAGFPILDARDRPTAGRQAVSFQSGLPVTSTFSNPKSEYA